MVELLRAAGIRPDQVTDLILSSVVPGLIPVFTQLAETRFHCTPLLVSPDLETGLKLSYTNPRELGVDRLVNATAAYARYRATVIVIDFGTATTFDAITQAGEFLGGVIAPGLGIAADALAARTAQLPKVPLVPPKTTIGRDTVGSIQSGLLYGYAGLVDAIVTRMRAELGQNATVIATGGLASVIAPECQTIQEVRPLLTLEGLELLHRLTRGDS
jgi:type III pantothenate kinase